MNVSGPLAGVTTRVPGQSLTLPAPPRYAAQWLTRALLVVLLFVVAVGIGLGLYASSHSGRIYQGVTVAGVDLSGLAPEQARASLESHFASYAETPLTLAAGDQTFPLTPAAAGARLDSDATIADAMAWGREGSLWDQSRAWARALVRGVAIAPRIAIDPATAQEQIAAIAPRVVKAPVDARLAFDGSGHAEVVPDETGVRLDYAATTSALTDRIRQFSTDPVPLVTHDDPASVTAASLAPNLPVAGNAIDAPLVLTAGDMSWTVAADDLQPLLVVDPASSGVEIARQPLVALVSQLATEIDRPAADAGITVDDSGRLAVVASVSAAKVEVDASVDAIAKGLLAGKDRVPLVVTETPPAISDEMAAAAVERGETLIGAGIALTWKGGEGELDRADLLRALTIRSRPGADEPFVFGLDPDLVRESLQRYAFDFDIPVQDARWRIIGGRIQQAVQESKGRELEIDRGVAAVMAAFLDQEPEVTLGVRTITPRWTVKDGAAITLGRDILGEGATYYGDSSDSRRQNIEVAASLLTGWLVPPDGTFSFADSVGLITEDKGYVTGLGIVDNGNGGFTTAPVIGGGICQVSTTLFQSAFWAGLPFVERHQHPYYLSNYGEAPTGLPGLDAMVNIEPDWTLDLRFKNTTGHWIAVIVIPDGNMLNARIVGTTPGWEVDVPDPEISNEVTPPSDMLYTDSPELPLGTERVVEVAQDGFDVTVLRTVKKNGKPILEDSVYSRFAPSRNTTLRGTGTGTD